MEIKEFNISEEIKWNKFVQDNISTVFFQQIGWKNVIENTYKHKPLYLLAEENKGIVGILPLFLVNSLILGKRLVSVPYGPYAGCSANNQNITNSLFEKANELAKLHNVKYLELRNTGKILGLPTNDKHVTMLLDLTQGEDQVWFNIRKGMKACVKKAAKENFSFNLDSNNLKGFYSVYCRRMHKLGTPIPPFSFFQNILDSFPDMKVATIDYKGEILASQLLLYFKKTVIYGWGASTNCFSESHPVHALLWKVIQKSIRDGYEGFDFGRSTVDSGTYDFKKWWGAEPKPLYYQYFLKRGQEIPYIHPSNPKYNMMIKTWQKLPLTFVNWLGPYVSKELI